MGALLEKIRQAVAGERYVIGAHANIRLRERFITSWQIIAGLAESRLLREKPDDLPHPVVEVEQHLPDGTPVKVVWGWIAHKRVAKLITVHYFDG